MTLERVRRTKISLGDMAIGATEWKDAVTGERANVTADGAQNAGFVQSNSLASQVTAAAILARANLLATQATLATRGSEVTLALVQAAVQIIDNCIETVGSAFEGDPAVIGGVAESGVPTEQADGVTVLPWFDGFGRLIQLATDLAQQALSVSDTAPAQMQVLVETGWVALTAPGQETPIINVQDYENLTIAYIIAFGACTDIDYIVWGSIDRTNWFKLAEDNVTTAEDNPDAVIVSCVAVKYLKCEFEAEAGDTDAAVTFQAMAGN